MKNLGLKAFALVLACVIWAVVSAPRREAQRERIVAASTSIVGLPPRLVITTEIPSTINVRVRGRVSELRALASQSLEASLDLSAVQAGDVVVTLRAHNINVPDGIEVVSISPSKIPFKVEPVRERPVPIRPFLAGDPPIGYQIGEATTEPARALVSGPASQILALTEVATDRIIMTGRTETFVIRVNVISDSPLVRVLSPPTTQVTVPVLAEVGPNLLPETTETSETTATSKREPQ